jgi:hypothetical protein
MAEREGFEPLPFLPFLGQQNQCKALMTSMLQFSPFRHAFGFKWVKCTHYGTENVKNHGENPAKRQGLFLLA